jgi:hypothetical protein
MTLVLGLVIGFVGGLLVGLALASSGKLNPGNCKVCNLFTKKCGEGGCEKPPGQ